MPAATTNAEQQAHAPGCPYIVKLLYAEPFALDAAALHAHLRDAVGDVDLMTAKPDQAVFMAKDAGVTLPNGRRAPVMLAVSRAEIGDLDASLSQSWDWPLARDVVSRARHALLVHDMMTLGLERKARLDLYDRFLRVVLGAAKPLAMHWMASERVVEPDSYLDTSEGMDRLAKGYVNVRLFRVEGRSPGECVMDTLGLAAFALPDLQCHFKGLDPSAVAAVLFNYAGYVFDKGDALADGNAVEGTVPGSKWRCRHEKALVRPDRVVVDFHPGPARPS
jgi:hypothetical protein